MWIGIPLVFAFLVEFAFYLVPGFEGMRELLTARFSKMALAPLLIVFFLAQRLFIQGVVITGVKG